MFLEPVDPGAAWTWENRDGCVHTIERLEKTPALSEATQFSDGITFQARMHPLMS